MDLMTDMANELGKGGGRCGKWVAADKLAALAWW